MPTTISNITTRAGNGGPLTANQMDANINNIKAFAEATRATLEGLTNNDGSLSSFNGATILNGTVENTKLKNIFYAADTSSTANSIVFTVAGASGQTSLSAGDLFLVKANTANTGSVTATITINSQALSPITLKKNLTNNLVSGQIKQNEMIAMIYDGTNLQVISDSLGALANFNNSTAGSMISYGSTGAPTAVAAGNEGQILVSNGANTPSFQSLSVVSNLPLIELTSSTVTNGVYWKAPTGVTKIRVLLMGGGGGGCTGGNNGGAGGGGGEYVEVDFDVASDDVYQIKVGAGGSVITQGLLEGAGTNGIGNGATTSISKITGTGGTGVINSTSYAIADGGSEPASTYSGGQGGGQGTSGNAAIKANPPSGINWSEVRTVTGSDGGNARIPYPGAAQDSDADQGGHGGYSYKGCGGFGPIGHHSTTGNGTTGNGYGYGGTGGNAESSGVAATNGGSGWIAIYDMTT